MSTEEKKQELELQHQHEHEHGHVHSHIDENGNVYTHCHDDDVLFSEHDHEHYHIDELGNLYSHVHDHGGDVPAHGHTHTQTKAVINRLSRAIGHLESVKRMVENGRDCTDVLIQLAAVRSALSSTAKVILKDHLEHCLYDLDPDDPEQLKALNDAIDRFM